MGKFCFCHFFSNTQNYYECYRCIHYTKLKDLKSRKEIKILIYFRGDQELRTREWVRRSTTTPQLLLPKQYRKHHVQSNQENWRPIIIYSIIRHIIDALESSSIIHLCSVVSFQWPEHILKTALKTLFNLVINFMLKNLSESEVLNEFSLERLMKIDDPILHSCRDFWAKSLESKFSKWYDLKVRGDGVCFFKECKDNKKS